MYNYLVKGIVALSITLQVVTKTTPHEPLSKGLDLREARARSLVLERVGFRGYVVFGLWFACFGTVGVLGFLFYRNPAISSDKDPCASSVEEL